MNFGGNFKKYRKQSGFTQKEIALMLGISQSNISDWENNVSRPEYENLIAIARIYDVTVDELLSVEQKLK
ncbi:MAG: helix-turn-helix domain-containing protein [Christensenellales bacterium]